MICCKLLTLVHYGIDSCILWKILKHKRQLSKQCTWMNLKYLHEDSEVLKPVCFSLLNQYYGGFYQVENVFHRLFDFINCIMLYTHLSCRLEKIEAYILYFFLFIIIECTFFMNKNVLSMTTVNNVLNSWKVFEKHFTCLISRNPLLFFCMYNVVRDCLLLNEINNLIEMNIKLFMFISVLSNIIKMGICKHFIDYFMLIFIYL